MSELAAPGAGEGTDADGWRAATEQECADLAAEAASPPRSVHW